MLPLHPILSNILSGGLTDKGRAAHGHQSQSCQVALEETKVMQCTDGERAAAPQPLKEGMTEMQHLCVVHTPAGSQ